MKYLKLNLGAIPGVILGGYVFFSTSLSASGFQQGGQARLTTCLLLGAALGTLVWNVIFGSTEEYAARDSKASASDREIYWLIGFVVVAVLIMVALLVTGIWNPMVKNR